MGKTSLQAAFDAGFASVKGYVDRSFEQFEQRIAQLEAHTREMRYCGVWREGTEYREGNLCTHAGGLWHCERATTSKPGLDSCWRLSVKAGSLSK
jgi:hypothetical protein